jgi:shikimate kinase
VHLWLIGMMGSGKTEVGRALAERLRLPFIDTDAVITTLSGSTIEELWESSGEEAFRHLESDAVRRSSYGDDAVIATGGGVVLSGANVELMRESGVVVWLEADAEHLASRLGQGAGRPLITGSVSVADRLDGILTEREDMYKHAAQHRVATEGRSIEEVADVVEVLWTGS